MRVESAQGVGFGRVLRRHRVAAGLTQEALAERAGLSARGISDLERAARTRPYPATVRRLAQALGLGEVDQRVLEMAAESAMPVDAASSSSFVAPSGILAAPLSSFVGREHEIAEVRHLLTSARLLTLLGPGGIGKTRLAVEVATAMADHFADGVAFVALASVRDPDLVIGAVAAALGIQETGGRALMERLHSHLRSSDLLLLLDNFEHVLPAAESVAWLLGSCPRLTVLATSRAPLHIAGEREFAVHPLALPPAGKLPPIDQLRNYEAVRLFIERSLSVRLGLELTDEQVRSVAEACARLDGLPLAIELAAARLRVLSPEMLLERLEYRLPVLVGGPRDAPARQRTLTATIDWSYDLLDPAEQQLFRQLSVFVGGFTLEAAEAVCGHADYGLPILDGLESLIANSLIVRDEPGLDEQRFHMLETVREYALQQASAAAELAELCRRHAAYFVKLAEQGQPKFASIDAPEWLHRLDADHNNLRTALRWALDERDADSALRLSSALWQFWYARGYLTEGSRWLEDSLRLADEASYGVPDAEDLPRVGRHVKARTTALTGAGILAHYQGHYARGATLCGQALNLSRHTGDQLGIAGALHGVALIARAGGNFEAARTIYEEARRIHEALNDRWGLSYTLRYLAVLLWMEANYSAARPVIEAALALAREIGDRHGAAMTLMVSSYLSRSLGENEAAEVAARQALELHESYGDRRGAAQSTWALGMAVAARGRLNAACASHKRAHAIFNEIGDRYFIVPCLIGLAEVAQATGGSQEAVSLLAAGSAVMANMGASLWPSLQAYIERTAEQARAVLGDAVFQQAWTSGSLLSVDQAVATAMAVREPPQASDVSRNSKPLTSRELAVARLIARGHTNKQIAACLVIAEGTADRHVANILDKLGFNSRAQIAAWTVEHGAATGD